MNTTKQFGDDPSGLVFQLAWDGRNTGTAADVTGGCLRVELDERPVWYGDTEGSGSWWTWVELLEFLGHQWNWLTHEQALPLGLRGSADTLQAQAADRWRTLPTAVHHREERRVRSFALAHNLAQALNGCWPADLWVLRRGRLCEVVANGRVHLLAADAVFGTLRDLGDEIAERAAISGDDRSRIAVETWKTRNTITAMDLVRAETGFAADLIEAHGGADRLMQFLDFSQENQDSPLLAAARMAGVGLSTEDFDTVVTEIRRVARQPMARVENWTARLAAFEPLGNPWTSNEVGRAAAQNLRKLLGNEASKLDVAALLQELAVDVRSITLSTHQIDAIAVWGPNNGPAVLLNSRGLHVRTPRGRRATLAHEVCHLLLDRNGALPLAEVLGGAAPPGVERRARAFAAELLVPTVGVLQLWQQQPNCEAAFKRLQQRYNASAEVVAWQMRNSIESLTYADRALLRSFVSQPHRF